MRYLMADLLVCEVVNKCFPHPGIGAVVWRDVPRKVIRGVCAKYRGTSLERGRRREVERIANRKDSQGIRHIGIFLAQPQILHEHSAFENTLIFFFKRRRTKRELATFIH
ncbi:hypothetical protein PENTCL1PPCAC_16923 [Pristionchus entomophagus]|uniref:Ribosomal protein n=1 Tax=Pristionchus entomophagus TaxID=358040 RepID=A0AAV5TKJ5_9BILA|nr:hypothetical protein PENTCL1PPCAC_16923 [Pristionchus entomophagus]